MKAYPVLTSAVPLDDYRLMLTFGEGERRLYDFKPNLGHKFYSLLADKRLFKNVSVNDGEIEWATGQDFCPHTLYENSTPADERSIISAGLADVEKARAEYAIGETVAESAIDWN
jgi:hypothetical protein